MNALSIALVLVAALAYDLGRRYLNRPTRGEDRIDSLAKRVGALESQRR